MQVTMVIAHVTTATWRTGATAAVLGISVPRRREVVVVGAGPAGSTAATYLARAGLDVLLLEKSTFPREKVCGDGLTPRGVKQLIDLGIDTRAEAGWLHNRGLRVVGVSARVGPERTPVTYRAPVVLACDGVSARLALSVGIDKNDTRPMGVAVRRYYESPRSKDDYLESHLELWDRSNPAEPLLLPGYGWIFGMGDGTVNVGLGILSTSKAFGTTDYRALLRSWLDGTPEEWGFREHNATGKIGGAALPMGFNRTPHYAQGLLLVGDAGGLVNPFNGEGIGFAMESAKLAAECVVQALARREGPARERALGAYPLALKQSLGSYYRLGNIFSRLIGNPLVMKVATRHGMPRTALMKLVLKLLAGLYDPRDGDTMDRLITAATRIVPSV